MSNKENGEIKMGYTTENIFIGTFMNTFEAEKVNYITMQYLFEDIYISSEFMDFEDMRFIKRSKELSDKLSDVEALLIVTHVLEIITQVQ